MERNRLVVVVGPSGSGKDSCIEAAVRAAPPEARLLRAHRYITRPPGPGESHVPLSPEEFHFRSQMGIFAWEWRAHGIEYAVGVEVDLWLAAGATVLVNGSRAALGDCCRRFDDPLVVHVDADPRTIAARLKARGREGSEAIAARLSRNPVPTVTAGTAVVRIDNDGDLDDAAARLLAAIGEEGKSTAGSSTRSARRSGGPV